MSVSNNCLFIRQLMELKYVKFQLRVMFLGKFGEMHKLYPVKDEKWANSHVKFHQKLCAQNRLL